MGCERTRLPRLRTRGGGGSEAAEQFGVLGLELLRDDPGFAELAEVLDLIQDVAGSRADGVRELREIDFYEVSIVPHPGNEDTGILSMKSSVTSNPEFNLFPSEDEIWARAVELEIEAIASKSAKARSV